MVFLACLGIPAGAQEADNGITGVVVDKWGNPVYGASVMVVGQPGTKVETDRNGKFELPEKGNLQLQVISVDKGTLTVKAENGKPVKIVMDYAGQTIDVGANRTFTRAESTASVSTVYNEDFDKRTAKNISNSLLGQG